MQARNLSKKFGQKAVLCGINLDLLSGETLGLIGPNGCGKSTLLAILSGLLRPDSGSVTLENLDFYTHLSKFKPLLSVISQQVALYPYLSASDHLKFFGKLFNLPNDQLRKNIQELISITQLPPHEPVKSYSGGMKHLLHIIIGLIHKPKLLFIDEPTANLDLDSVQVVKTIIQYHKEQGGTCLLISHDFDFVQTLCRRIAVLIKGNIQHLDTPENLIHQFSSGSIHIRSNSPKPSIQHAFDKLASKMFLDKTGVTIQTDEPQKVLPLIASTCYKNRIAIQDIRLSEPNLNNAFLNMTHHKNTEEAKCTP